MGSQGSSRTWCRVGCWGISEEQMQRGSTAGVVCQGAWVTVGAPADIPPWRVVRYLTSSGMKLLHCRVLGVGAEKRTLLTATTVLGGCHRAGSCRATGGHWGHGAPAQMARGGVSGGRSTQQSSELVGRDRCGQSGEISGLLFLSCQVGTAIHGLSVPMEVDDVDKSSGSRVRNAVSVSSAFPLEFPPLLYPSK